MILFFGMTLTCLYICGVECYPDGPPLSACVDMIPRTQMGELELEGHTEEPQNVFPTHGRPAIPPYHIMFSDTLVHYEPNTPYSVHVISNQTGGGNAYMGLLMQAREVHCYGNGTIGVRDDAIGSFSLPSNSLLKTMNCGDKDYSAVCHKSRQWKINETVTWNSPDNHEGHIAFWATIVQHDVVYWTGLHSHALLDPNKAAPEPCTGAFNEFSSRLLAVSLITALIFSHDLFYK